MYIIIKAGYGNNIAIPVGEEVGKIVAGMEGAKVVSEPSWNETQYKVGNTAVTFTIVPDNLIGPGDPLVEVVKEDLSRAHKREADEREKRLALEKELTELKEKFAPFLEKDEQTTKTEGSPEIPF